MTSCLSAVAQIGRQGLGYQSGVYGCSGACFPPWTPYFPAGPLASPTLHPESAGGVNAAAGIDCEHDKIGAAQSEAQPLYRSSYTGRNCRVAPPFGAQWHSSRGPPSMEDWSTDLVESESASQLIVGFHRNRYQQPMSWWDPKVSMKRRSCGGGAGEISGYTTTMTTQTDQTS